MTGNEGVTFGVWVTEWVTVGVWATVEMCGWLCS